MIRFIWILTSLINSSWATDYTLVLEDSDLYAECTEGPPGSIGLREAFDMSNIVTDLEEDGLHLSGNCTTVWDIPRTDRIAARMMVMQFERGTWTPTVFSLYAYDFCAVMFDPNQLWFKYWFKYFANREEIKEKCVGTKDTVMVYNPFILKLYLENVIGSTFRGLFKAVVTFEPFDENNIKRPFSLCFEVRGTAEKVDKALF
ncbi:uncharacterized protein LOC108115445 [Drosophila eugracilis]|uniref:uncharacterized protein LOC108115445 n=1 Tax=Drosophila eugracilis TaxID=29029 RepID=UPI001BDA7236|nr:uncharacterized protein LOC108115445 [Drosophila eugracilis]